MITPTIAQLDKYTTHINAVIKHAAKLYDLPALTQTSIRYNLRGMCAGQAQRNYKGQLLLRFNMEAIAKDFDGMYNDTIPHEVAHLVCMLNPMLGDKPQQGVEEGVRVSWRLI